MSEDHYEKLTEPKIIELDSSMEFLLATEVDLSNVVNGIIYFRGEHYTFESGTVACENEKYELRYSIKQNGHGPVEYLPNY